MGRRILVQRKGRGTLPFKALDHLKVGPVKYLDYNVFASKPVLTAVIKEFIHEPGRQTPLAKVVVEETGDSFLYIPPEGVFLGGKIEMGYEAEAKVGNILPLSKIPDGTLVSNVELRIGDGGKIARRSGTYAMVIAHEGDKVVLKLPSGAVKRIDGRCRATIGVVSGGGRMEKPFLKAGTKYYFMKKRAGKWPVVRGVAMNPVAHPHGGGCHRRPGKPTTVPRTAPPGQKVGHIAARKTGRGKRKRKFERATG